MKPPPELTLHEDVYGLSHMGLLVDLLLCIQGNPLVEVQLNNPWKSLAPNTRVDK